MSYLPITSEISGQFLIRLHGKAEIGGELEGHLLVYFGDRAGFVVPTFGPHSVVQAYEYIAASAIRIAREQSE